MTTDVFASVKNGLNITNTMYFLCRVLLAINLLDIFVSPMPTQKVLGPTGCQLARIAMHSCQPDKMYQSRCDPEVMQDAPRPQQSGEILGKEETLILETLASSLFDLNKTVDAIVTQSVVHNAMSDTFNEDEVASLKKSFKLKAEWELQDSSLTSQQLIRLKALIRVAGYVYCLQAQDYSNSLTFGSDVHRLQATLEKLRRVTCNLHDLQPNVNILEALSKSDNLESFCSIDTQPEWKQQIMMGLTIVDIHAFVKDVTAPIFLTI